jgi:hypothetical protein
MPEINRFRAGDSFFVEVLARNSTGDLISDRLVLTELAANIQIALHLEKSTPEEWQTVKVGEHGILHRNLSLGAAGDYRVTARFCARSGPVDIDSTDLKCMHGKPVLNPSCVKL